MVKPTPSLLTPLTVTMTLPVVAPLGTCATIWPSLQLVGVADIPLNVTVLLPWIPLKFDPAIVTEAPMAPEDGDRLDIPGVAPEPPPALAASHTL
jgi:hypothetical protein